MKYLNILTKEKLLECIAQKLTLKQIADALGFNKKTIRKYVRFYKLKFNGTFGEQYNHILTKEFLIQAMKNGESSLSISKKININARTIRSYLAKYGLRFDPNSRPSTKSRKITKIQKQILREKRRQNSINLVQELLKDRNNLQDIIRKSNLHYQTVKKILKLLGQCPKKKHNDKFSHILTKEYLENCVKTRKSATDISKETGICFDTICKYFRKFGLRSPRKPPKGNQSHSWRGGKCKETEILRHSHEYKMWRKFVFERDNYTCQACGIRGGKLHTHHIKPFSCFPELRFDANNGITLCETCHIKTPSYGNNSRFFKQLQQHENKSNFIFHGLYD